MFLQKFVQKAVSRIVKDFKQKELIPLKILFFVQAATIAVLYPYLTIHMRELGISIEETAIMSAIVPVIGIIMPPLAGMVADKIGNFKILLSLASLIGGFAALLLLLVPPAKIRIGYPEELLFDFGCGNEYLHPEFGIADDIPCERLPANKTCGELDLRFESCGVVCSATTETSDSIPAAYLHDDVPFGFLLRGSSYSIRIDSNSETSSATYIVNDGHHGGSIRSLSGGRYFFGADNEFGLRCRRVDASGGYTCVIGGDHARGSGAPEDAPPRENLFRNRTVTLNFPEHADDDATVANFTDAMCFDPRTDRDAISVSVHLYNPEDPRVTDAVELFGCRPRCLATGKRSDVCSNTDREVVQDPELTFWAYLFVRVLIGIIGSTTYSMFEVAVISILREQKADYGLQRIYSTIGGIVASPLSGYLIDYASRGKLGTDYSPAFYLYAALKVLFSLLILLISLEFKQAAKSVISDFLQVVRNSEVLCLLSSCFVLGCAWGYIESFLFWFLQDLGGNRSLMGITVTVGGVAGIPLLILSGPIIDKIGHANVIFIGFVFYAIRLLGYSLIYNPYHCLFFEAMESITSSLAITAAVTYAAKLSTTTTDGSIQGLVGGLYYGVGRGAGTLIGGYLMKSYGTRYTFRIFAAFTLSTGVVYFLINQCYIRKLPNREGNDICKKEPKKEKKSEDEVKVITEKGKEANAESQKVAEEHRNEGFVPDDVQAGKEPPKSTGDVKEE